MNVTARAVNKQLRWFHMALSDINNACVTETEELPEMASLKKTAHVPQLQQQHKPHPLHSINQYDSHFTTSANEVMFYLKFVCLFVCLSVC